jgi:SGNH domain-containing protein
VRAWRALTRTVRRIVVIRDTPKARPAGGVIECVSRALARHRAAGRACAVQRHGALDPDPAAVAARRVAAPRADVIDMTDVFCDRHRCYPVIGGALAYKDSNHLTRVFVASAGPILERRVDALLR